MRPTRVLVMKNLSKFDGTQILKKHQVLIICGTTETTMGIWAESSASNIIGETDTELYKLWEHCNASLLGAQCG